MPYRMTLLLLSIALCGLGCGDDADGDGLDQGGDHHSGPNACGNVDNCMGTVELEEGLATEGEDAKFTLTVDAHSALTPTDNDWDVIVTDAAGDPAANATLTVSTWSVDCGHGGPSDGEEVTTDADGKATIHPVAAHGGPWDVIVKVEQGSTEDTVTVHLCIPGEADAG